MKWLQNYGITEGQGKSNIGPLFQSGAINNLSFVPVENVKKT